MEHRVATYEEGWRAGYAKGYSDGIRFGKCQGVARCAADRFGLGVPAEGEAGRFRRRRVLFVKSGLWAYRPMDDGIAAELALLTEATMAVEPTADVVGAARQFAPDLVLVLNSVECLKAETVAALGAAGFRRAVWFTDDPYYSDVSASLAIHYDDVFTLESSCVPFYRSLGCERVHHLPFAANTALFAPLRADLSYRRDVCFIGSAFWNRVAFFDQTADYLAGKRTLIAGYWWNRLSHYQKLASSVRSGYWVSPEETALYYNGAKIAINFHRAIDDETNRNSSMLPARSVNPRTFEIAACGTLQLTDAREELAAMYEPGRELDVYASPAELTAKIEYYLQHEEERREIAQRGLERTLRDHTYRNRLLALLSAVFEG